MSETKTAQRTRVKHGVRRAWTVILIALAAALPPASKVRTGLPKVVLKIARIFSTSATAVVGTPSLTFTFAPPASAGGSFGV